VLRLRIELLRERRDPVLLDPERMRAKDGSHIARGPGQNGGEARPRSLRSSVDLGKRQ